MAAAASSLLESEGFCALMPDHTYLSRELEAFLVQTHRTHEDVVPGPVWIHFSPEEHDADCASYFPDMTSEETCMYLLSYDCNGDTIYIENDTYVCWLYVNIKDVGWVQFRCTQQDGGEPHEFVLREEPADALFYTLLQKQQPQPQPS